VSSLDDSLVLVGLSTTRRGITDAGLLFTEGRDGLRGKLNRWSRASALDSFTDPVVDFRHAGLAAH
jgi:hypothetical protein